MFVHCSSVRTSSVTVSISKATHSNTRSFKHPTLSQTELQFGSKLGWDSWAETSCSGKHAYVEEFVEGRTVTATGFSSSLGSIKDLPIAHVLYAYDAADGETLILEHNNTVYLGDNLVDSLANPIQSEDNDVRVDIRPKVIYNEARSQSVSFPDGTIIPIMYEGVLPYIPIRRPTPGEIHDCRRLPMTSKFDWDPHAGKESTFCLVNSELQPSSLASIVEFITNDEEDYFCSDIFSSRLSNAIRLTPFLYETESNDGNRSYCSINALRSTSKDTMTPEMLAKKWRIGLKTAARTLAATTHECIRTTGLLSRRFRTDKSQLRYRQLSKVYGSFYCDFLKSSVKSIRGFVGGVLYTNKLGFMKFFPRINETGDGTGHSLRSFINIVGLPFAMHSDNHKNFKEGLFKQLLRKFGIVTSYTEPHSAWQNRAEPAIGEVKKLARRSMQATGTPIRLWCFCYEYCADILSLCATGRYDLKGRTPYECVMHSTPDISEYVSFDWFQYCWYFNEATKEKELCRWLGPAHNVGQSFCCYILLFNGSFIARSSVVPIESHELLSDEMKLQCLKFTTSVEEKLGTAREAVYDSSNPSKIYYDAFFDDPADDDNELPYGDEVHEAVTAETDAAYLEEMDEMIGLSIQVEDQHNAVPILAEIKKRKRNSQGDVIGEKNDNPLLDTRIYILEYPDGRVAEYGMNIIAENLLAQIDEEGFDCALLKEIIDCRFDSNTAVSRFDCESSNGAPVITTRGVDLQVIWHDQSTSWIPLKDMKAAYPIEVAEYAIANGIQNEPAFKWWVAKTMRSRDYLIGKCQIRAVRKPERTKFGIPIPMTAPKAKEYDHQNGNTKWTDAIKKEMTNSKVAFKLLSRSERPRPGSTRITCHLIFDVKLDGTYKARYVAGGHLTDPPSSLTYASVVSRESVRIGFLVAALNNLDILAGDIQNAYLNAETKEKVHFYAGSEWGSDEGRCVVIVRALYGLKSSALAWRNCISDVIANKMGFQSSLADPDVWFKAMTAADGSPYYSYILVYSDDILIIDKNPSIFMAMFKESFTVKPGSIGTPKRYLGADISKTYLSDNSVAWTMSAESYIAEAVKNVKTRMAKDGLMFNKQLSSMEYSPKQAFTTASYRPELDVTAECTDDQAVYFQQLIGVLRWIVELGRIDICFEVSALSSFVVSPRTGHLTQALHMFKYLDLHRTYKLCFGTAYHDFGSTIEVQQKSAAMKELYRDAQEDLPPNAPLPRGRPIQINCFVDSDHAGNSVTRRSQTGIIIFGNNAPLVWYSKKQNTVESSSFGSEFVALRVASELIISLRYKLRMFGIELEGPANVLCDNQSVFINASEAKSNLNKKHNSICFHRVRECVASSILFPFKVDTKENLADILTKNLSWHIKKDLLYQIMYVEDTVSYD